VRTLRHRPPDAQLLEHQQFRNRVRLFSKGSRTTAILSELISGTALMTAIASPAKAQAEAQTACTAADAAYSAASPAATPVMWPRF
jgi:hypothetical protein